MALIIGDAITWEQRKLGEISYCFEYGLNAAAKEYDGHHKYLRITDINENTHEFENDNLTSPDIDFEKATDCILHEGDILFARTGASVGKSYRYQSKDGLVYYAGFLIRAKIKEEYDSEFIYQNTLTYKYKKYVSVASQRSGQPGVNAKEYSNYFIKIPTKQEQIRISEMLKKFDNTIALHQRKMEKLELLKKAYLQKIFNQEIRFKGFNEEWEQRKLGDVCDISAGGDVDKTKLVINGDYPVLANALTNNGIVGYYNDYKIKAPAVTVTGRGDIGHATARYCNYTPTVRLLTLKSKHFDMMFLENAINNTPIFIESTGVPQLTSPQLGGYSIRYPLMEEQMEIGNFFKLLNSTIALHRKMTKKLSRIKQSLLQKMFI